MFFGKKTFPACVFLFCFDRNKSPAFAGQKSSFWEKGMWKIFDNAIYFVNNNIYILPWEHNRQMKQNYIIRHKFHGFVRQDGSDQHMVRVPYLRGESQGVVDVTDGGHDGGTDDSSGDGLVFI